MSSRQKGFSLVEVAAAIVLFFVVGALLALLMTSLVQSARQLRNTRNEMQAIRRAVAHREFINVTRHLQDLRFDSRVQLGDETSKAEIRCDGVTFYCDYECENSVSAPRQQLGGYSIDSYEEDCMQGVTRVIFRYGNHIIVAVSSSPPQESSFVWSTSVKLAADAPVVD